MLATQNPIEQEGTYPLPEAQQDRFMFKVFVTYPSFDEEMEVARRTTGGDSDEVEPVLSPRGDHRAAGPRPQGADQRPRDPLHAGAGAADARPRAGGAGVRARAIGLGRRTAGGAIPDPRREGPGLAAGPGPRRHGRIQALAKPVLRHRLVVNFAAESEGVTTDDLIDQLMTATPAHEDELIHDERFQKIFAT